MENSKIEWTHHTFNPWIGCSKVSPGCEHCYAENLMDLRYGKVKWGPQGTRQITSKSNWEKPMKWNEAARESGKRHRVFCASLADVFEDRPDLIQPRTDLLELIFETEHLDWLLLTKRPENFAKMWPVEQDGKALQIWPNVWIGVSVEDQQRADERIPLLLQIPARVRFLSVEPLLGPVDLHAACPPDYELFNEATEGAEGWYPPEEFIEECEQECDWVNYGNDLVPSREHAEWEHDRERFARSLAFKHSIQWAIVGGESGPQARPCNVEWVRAIVQQCRAAKVPCFVKQLGSHAVTGAGHRLQGGRERGGWHDHTKGGDPRDWPEEVRVREIPESKEVV